MKADTKQEIFTQFLIIFYENVEMPKKYEHRSHFPYQERQKRKLLPNKLGFIGELCRGEKRTNFNRPVGDGGLAAARSRHGSDSRTGLSFTTVPSLRYLDVPR